MAGCVAQTRQPLNIDNYQTWEYRARQYDNMSFGAVVEVPIIFAGELIGVLAAYETGDSRRTYTETDQRLLSLFATHVASAIRTARLLDELQASNLELAQAYDTTLEGWAKALELRDKETEGHSQRVSELTLRLARRMNIPESEIPHIHRGVLLHDIGKMGIPDRIPKKGWAAYTDGMGGDEAALTICLFIAGSDRLPASCAGYPLLPP